MVVFALRGYASISWAFLFNITLSLGDEFDICCETRVSKEFKFIGDLRVCRPKLMHTELISGA